MSAKENGTSPTWNKYISFTVDEATLQQGRLHLKVEINIKRTTGSKKVGDTSFPVKELLGQKNSTDQMRKTSMMVNEVIKNPSPNLHHLSLRWATRLTLHLGSSILHNNFPLSRLVHSPTIIVVTLTLPTHIRHPAPALCGLMQVIPIILHLADSILLNSFTLNRVVTFPTTRAFTLPTTRVLTLPTHIPHLVPALYGLMQVIPIMLHLADTILPNSFTLSRVVTLPTTRAFTLPTTRVFTLTLPIQRTCHPPSALHRLMWAICKTLQLVGSILHNSLTLCKVVILPLSSCCSY